MPKEISYKVAIALSRNPLFQPFGGKYQAGRHVSLQSLSREIPSSNSSIGDEVEKSRIVTIALSRNTLFQRYELAMDGWNHSGYNRSLAKYPLPTLAILEGQ